MTDLAQVEALRVLLAHHLECLVLAQDNLPESAPICKEHDDAIKRIRLELWHIINGGPSMPGPYD